MDKDTTVPVTAAERATDARGDQSPFALGMLLRRAHDRAANAMADTIRPLGLELRHFAALTTLNRRGPLNQRELGALMGSDKTTLGRTIDELETAGLVVRRPVPGDKRVRVVELTEKGLETFDAAHVPARTAATDLVSHLGPGEADQLLDLLTRFTYPPA